MSAFEEWIDRYEQTKAELDLLLPEAQRTAALASIRQNSEAWFGQARKRGLRLLELSHQGRLRQLREWTSEEGVSAVVFAFYCLEQAQTALLLIDLGRDLLGEMPPRRRLVRAARMAEDLYGPPLRWL